MKRVVNLRMIGRWGNQLFQWAYAKKYCELYDCELRTEPWVGYDLFELNHTPIQERFPVVHTELTVNPGETRFEFRSYFQMQKAMIYSQADIWRWFQWKPKVTGILGHRDDDILLAHLRRGDYFGYGYPVVSIDSYYLACHKFGLPVDHLKFISEEHPTTSFDPPFVADFWRLTNAPVLLRANSSFSWWAAAMAKNQRVFSPVIDGLEGGKEHEVEFVEGNYPRLANLDFVTDLHLCNLKKSSCNSEKPCATNTPLTPTAL